MGSQKDGFSLRSIGAHPLSSVVPQGRHHAYKGCLVMIFGSHAEVLGSMLGIRQNYCNTHEKLMYALSKA